MTGAPPLITNRVLAAVSASGRKLEMVREDDGFVSIMLDGAMVPACRWPSDRLEHCVAFYMALLHQQAEHAS